MQSRRPRVVKNRVVALGLAALLGSACGGEERAPESDGTGAELGEGARDTETDTDALQGSGSGAGGSGTASEPGSGVGGEGEGSEGAVPLAPGAEPPSPAQGSSAAAASAGAAGAAGGTSIGQPAAGADGVLQILAVGDSITRATCWRAALWEQLQASDPSRFDFVGTLSSDNGCGPAGYDQDNQGYSSSLVTEIVAGTTDARQCDPAPCPTLDDLRQGFSATQPDVALMHFGTNDVWNGRPIESIVSAYSMVLDALRATNPAVTVLVAQIIPMNVTDATCGGCTCPSCPTDIPALNARIASWAADSATPTSNVIVVDQFSGYDANLDNRDGVHPNDAGSQKMAERWYAALAPLF
jgi:lysophospholipase L1-like esterase